MRRKPRTILLAINCIVAAFFLPGLAFGAGETDKPITLVASQVATQSVVTAQNTSTSATDAINNLKNTNGYKVGQNGSATRCVTMPSDWTDCYNGCYHFVAAVCRQLYGSAPGGVEGYKLTSPGNFDCVGCVENRNHDSIKSLLQKAYPGDVIQLKSAPVSTISHTAIVESVSADGIRIYDHWDPPTHVRSEYYSWSKFFSNYANFSALGTGISLYHAKNYNEIFPDGDTKGEMYPGNTVTTVPQKTECVIKASANKSFVWDVQGASGYDGCNLQIYTRKDIPCQKFTFERNEDGTYHILNWSGNYGVYVGLTDWTYANQANVVMRYTCEWTINCWYVETTPDGYYSFRNKHSGKYLEVSGGNIADGTSLKQHVGNGTAAQKFAIEFQMYPGNELVGPDELDEKMFIIESSGAENLVWDVQGGHGQDGTNLQICNRNNTLAQRFKFYANDDGTYSISNWSGSPGTLVGLGSDSYIDGANVAVRTFVRTWDINKWYVEKTPDGYYSFRNKFSSLYADIDGGVFSSGRNIWQFQGNGTPAQKFNLIDHEDNVVADDIPEGDPGFVIRNAQDSGFVLTVDDNGSGNHYNATMRSYSATEFQRFVFWHNEDDGTYTISNWGASAGLALGLGDWNQEQGVNVEAHDLVRDHAINRWYVETTADGYYSFRNKYSGKYLDATGCIEGYNVLQWGTNDGELQKWILEPCDYYYTSLRNAEIVLSENSFSYTGEAVEPTVTVKLGGAVVDPEKYTVQYADNVEAGEASVSVVGKKSALYDGSATTIFIIARAPIGDASVTGVNASYTYTGEPIEPKPQVSYGGKALVEGSDYAVSYIGSEGVGDASVTIIGLGNYAGEKNVEFAIEPIRVDRPTAASFTYDGIEHTGVSEAAGFGLTGTTSETSAGDYSAIALLSFGYAWNDGSLDDLELNWRIDPAAVTSAALSESSFIFNGEVQRPSVRSVQAGALVLSESDYDVSYSNENSKDVGTYTVTVTGKGNFYGSQSATYKIEPSGSEDEDRAAAEAVISKIAAIGAVTLDSGDAIKVARAAYNALTADQKALVPATALEALMGAEASYKEMADEKAASDKKAADKDAATEAITAIASIGTVGKNSAGAIAAARKAYDALTADQKALVPASVFATLASAEATYAKIAAPAKKANPISVKAKAISLKASVLAKKKLTVKRAKAFKVTDAKGKVAFKVVKYITKKAKGKVSVTSAGKVVVKKGTKRGTYKLKVKVTASGDTSFNAGSKVVKLVVRVK